MIYWTVIPLEAVWNGWEEMSCPWVEIEYQGIQMIVEPADPPGYGRVVRLLSPRPGDYLRPDLTPGSLVPLTRAPL